MKRERTTRQIFCDGCGKRIDGSFNVQLARYLSTFKDAKLTMTLNFEVEEWGERQRRRKSGGGAWHYRKPDYCKRCFRKWVKEYMTLLLQDE